MILDKLENIDYTLNVGTSESTLKINRKNVR